MIGTNMLQTTPHPGPALSLPRRRRALATGRRGLRALGRLCAATVCAAVLLSPVPLAAQNAPAKPASPTVPPPAVPSPLAPTEVPGAQQGASDVGKQLFPNAPKNPLAAPAENPAPAQPGGDTRGLDQEIQGLKKDVVDLNKDLFILEEELLFPANTQVAVFLSMDVGDFFALDSVQLKLDQKEVINYLYTPRERDALLKGGVQRLYLGNLKVGTHELVAFFSGSGPNARAYKRGASLRFEKGVGAKYLELKINDRQRKLEPEFEIKDWE
jgi:hypothetical protein